MAKFAKNEGNAFSPIDTKMLGGLAEAPPAALVETPSAEPPPIQEAQEAAPAIVKMESPSKPARPAKPEQKSARKPTPAKQAEPERMSRVVKCLFTPSEETELRNLMSRLRDRSGLTLSFSHLMRPLCELLRASEDELGEALANAALRRPATFDKAAVAEFEQELATVLHAAFRKTKPAAKP